MTAVRCTLKDYEDFPCSHMDVRELRTWSNTDFITFGIIFTVTLKWNVVPSERTRLEISVWQWAGRYSGEVASVFAGTRGRERSRSHSFGKQIFTLSPARPSCALADEGEKQPCDLISERNSRVARYQGDWYECWNGYASRFIDSRSSRFMKMIADA